MAKGSNNKSVEEQLIRPRDSQGRVAEDVVENIRGTENGKLESVSTVEATVTQTLTTRAGGEDAKSIEVRKDNKAVEGS